MTMILCGVEIQIDAEDVDRVLSKRWYKNLAAGGRLRFTTRVSKSGRSKKITLQRFIFDPPDDMWLGHEPFAGEFDYRRSAWKICSMAERQAMIPKRSKIRSSTYKGVSMERSGRWRAGIRPAGQSIYLGTFDTEKEAALAYDRAALIHFGPKAFQNFPAELVEES